MLPCRDCPEPVRLMTHLAGGDCGLESSTYIEAVNGPNPEASAVRKCLFLYSSVQFSARSDGRGQCCHQFQGNKGSSTKGCFPNVGAMGAPDPTFPSERCEPNRKKSRFRFPIRAD